MKIIPYIDQNLPVSHTLASSLTFPGQRGKPARQKDGTPALSIPLKFPLQRQGPQTQQVPGQAWERGP